jgi:hypothetical protein
MIFESGSKRKSPVMTEIGPGCRRCRRTKTRAMNQIAEAALTTGPNRWSTWRGKKEPKLKREQGWQRLRLEPEAMTQPRKLKPEKLERRMKHMRQKQELDVEAVRLNGIRWQGNRRPISTSAQMNSSSSNPIPAANEIKE